MTRKKLRLIHQWCGLLGALWLIVLGLTGLMLDHRDDWGWAWRWQLPGWALPEHTRETLQNRHVTLAQTNPDDASQWLVGGPAGIWYSADSAQTWHSISFQSRPGAPMVNAMVLDEVLGWRKVWLATEDGLWSWQPELASAYAQREGLPGSLLTGLDNGALVQQLALVEDRSRILIWDKAEKKLMRTYALDQVAVSGLPEQVSWSRFLFDMHLGRAFIQRDLDIWINDFGAVAFVLLAVSGFLSWFWRRRWRGGRGPSGKKKGQAFKWLYNLHAPMIGLLALFPLFYLAVTGIVMDHRSEWMMPLVRNQIPRSALPPVYDFSSLRQEVSHLIAHPHQPEHFTVGTRLGVLTSTDGGQQWQRELGQPMAPGFVWSLKRFDDRLFLGGLGGPSFSRLAHEPFWTPVPGLRGMPSDVTMTDALWFAISGPNMFSGDPVSGMDSAAFNLPQLPGTPLMLTMFELHNGGIFGAWFRYWLDACALITLFMLVTGPILWWRRKWAR